MQIAWGKQKELAVAAGVSEPQLSDILRGHKRCPSALAVKLERVSEAVLGEKVYSTEWILAGLGLRKGASDGTEGDGTADAGN